MRMNALKAVGVVGLLLIFTGAQAQGHRSRSEPSVVYVQLPKDMLWCHTMRDVRYVARDKTGMNLLRSIAAGHCGRLLAPVHGWQVFKKDPPSADPGNPDDMRSVERAILPGELVSEPDRAQAIVYILVDNDLD